MSMGQGRAASFARMYFECTKNQMSLKKNDKNNGKKRKNFTEIEKSGENSTKYLGKFSGFKENSTKKSAPGKIV